MLVMPYPDSFILLVMGAVFLGVGLPLLFWGKRAEKRYYNGLASRTDMREFIEHSPEYSGPGALKLGGWISIIIGLVMLGIGGGLRLWG